MTASRVPPPIEFTKAWIHDAITKGESGPIPLTDLGNSERLVIAHATNLRHIQLQKRWFSWDGKRFRPDADGQVRRLAKETARNILLEAAAETDDGIRTKIRQHQVRSESDRAVRAMMSLAESAIEIARRTEDFDANPNLFNVENGTLDLETGELRPHSRDDQITKLARV